MSILARLGQDGQEPNMIFVASAKDFQITSIGIQLNWPVVGVAGIITVAAWLVFVVGFCFHSERIKSIL